ncbi:MAG: hypothetical protein RSD67_05195 [Oscillospiraceae bacterium]
MDCNTDIIKELVETTSRSKSNLHQINELKVELKDVKEQNKAIYEIATSVKLIAQDVSNIKEDMFDVKEKQNDLNKSQTEIKGELKKEISEVKEAPTVAKAKFLDDTKNKIWVIIFTALVGFILHTLSPVIFR